MSKGTISAEKKGDFKNPKSTRDSKDSRDSKSLKNLKVALDSMDSKFSKISQDSKGFKIAQNFRDSKNLKSARNSKDSKISKITQNSKNLKNPKKPAKTTLRVLGGIYKGRKLQIAPLEITRSSKAILKESLFNTLRLEVVGACFVEFFAGSGSIGIEALSRGAKFALFFENNKESCNILESNLLNICQNQHYKIIFGDTFYTYKNAIKSIESLESQSKSIGYFDPPFNVRDGMLDIYEKCFAMIENLDSNVFKYIIIEHISSLKIPQNIGRFSYIKSKKFGKSALSYFSNEV